jgi:hypothetical protein
MDLEDSFQIEHLYLSERKCRVCGETKNLIDGFYRIRKNKYQQSAYSYECKSCTVIRITANRMANKVFGKWEYPDW